MMNLEREFDRRATEVVLASDLRFAVLAWERDTAQKTAALTVEIDALREAYRKLSDENAMLRVALQFTGTSAPV